MVCSDDKVRDLQNTDIRKFWKDSFPLNRCGHVSLLWGMNFEVRTIQTFRMLAATRTLYQPCTRIQTFLVILFDLLATKYLLSSGLALHCSRDIHRASCGTGQFLVKIVQHSHNQSTLYRYAHHTQICLILACHLLVKVCIASGLVLYPSPTGSLEPFRDLLEPFPVQWELFVLFQNGTTSVVVSVRVGTKPFLEPLWNALSMHVATKL